MPDPRVPLLSASILTTLIATSLTSSPDTPSAELKDALSKFYKYLSTVSKSGDQDQQDLAIRSYVALLRTQQAREIFWNMKEDTVSPLAAILEAATGGAGETGEHARASGAVFQGGVPLQLLYHVLLVIWQLSFEETVAEEINEFVPRHLASRLSLMSH
jgi:V-type H+-transporting ATPase subunit H